MPYDNIISRSDADALIPIELATDLIAAATQESAALSLFRRAQLSTKTNRMPVLSALLAKRGPYHLRHTFATEALAAGVSIFELSRLMGASVKTIDKHYGHLARDSEDAIRAGLQSRSKRSGVDQASADEAD